MAKQRDQVRLNNRVAVYTLKYKWFCPKGWWSINRQNKGLIDMGRYG